MVTGVRKSTFYTPSNLLHTWMIWIKIKLYTCHIFDKILSHKIIEMSGIHDNYNYGLMNEL